MTEHLSDDKRLNMVGKIAGSVAFAVGGSELVFAGAELAGQQRFDAAVLGALGAAAIGLGKSFWRRSTSPEDLPAEPAADEPQPSYLYAWAEGIGWVPLHPYDPDGPVGLPEPPRGDN